MGFAFKVIPILAIYIISIPRFRKDIALFFLTYTSEITTAPTPGSGFVTIFCLANPLRVI